MIDHKDLEYNFERHIGLTKAVLWEEAKGKLRAIYAAGGQVVSSRALPGEQAKWRRAAHAIETFIQDFECDGLHE